MREACGRASVMPDKQAHQEGIELKRRAVNPGDITTTCMATAVGKCLRSCSKRNHLTHSLNTQSRACSQSRQTCVMERQQPAASARGGPESAAKYSEAKRKDAAIEKAAGADGQQSRPSSNDGVFTSGD
jgi:hypothetical protein